MGKKDRKSSRGEGRAPAEKAGRILITADERKRRKARREAEDWEWAERSGPVEIKRVEKNP